MSDGRDGLDGDPGGYRDPDVDMKWIMENTRPYGEGHLATIHGDDIPTKPDGVDSLAWQLSHDVFYALKNVGRKKKFSVLKGVLSRGYEQGTGDMEFIFVLGAQEEKPEINPVEMGRIREELDEALHQDDIALDAARIFLLNETQWNNPDQLDHPRLASDIKNLKEEGFIDIVKP